MRKQIIIWRSLENNKQKSGILIFPKAGASHKNYDGLCSLLKTKFNIYVVESGYNGLPKPVDFKIFSSFIINNLKYRKVDIIVAESVGAVYAIKILANNSVPIKLLLFSNPALFKPTFLTRIIGISILDYCLKNPDTFLCWVSEILKTLPLNIAQNISALFERMTRTVGAKSYLDCLGDIAHFYPEYNKDTYLNIIKKSYILGAGSDYAFTKLCDRDFCMKAKKYISLEKSDHAILTKYPDIAAKILLSNYL